MEENVSLSVQMYNIIKDRIKSLEYLPGSIIRERDLTENLGVSRTPIREALQRLIQEDWLIQGDAKSLQVRDITTKDVFEIIQIRNLVEYAALDYIIDNDKTRILAGFLDALLSKMKSCKDDKMLTQVDLDFHHLLVKSMDNARILKFWETVQDEVYRMGLVVIREKDRWPQVIVEHENFVEALWSKDKTKIVATLKEHLEHSYASLIDNLKNIDSANSIN